MFENQQRGQVKDAKILRWKIEVLSHGFSVI